jgi:hypothetical protein
MSWIQDAAAEIGQVVAAPAMFVQRFQAIVAKHAPSVPRCETCTHWDAFEERHDGRCLKGVAESLYRDDDGDVSAGTNKDFGCVKWEVRDAV